MKTLENKTISILKDEKTQEYMKYSDLCKAILDFVDPKVGLTVSQQKERFKILDVIESANGEIKLEDADYSLLKGILDNYKFGIQHRDIVMFADDFNALNK